MLGQAVAAIALTLLGVSGVAKVLNPNPTAGAIRAAELPASPWTVRLLGLVEFAAAIAALTIGGVWLLVAAGLYVGFGVFVIYALRRRIPIQSCGCFGRTDTPPSWLHLAFNLVAALGLTTVAALGLEAIPLDLPIGEVAIYLVFTGLGAVASFLALTHLTTLKALWTS